MLRYWIATVVLAGLGAFVIFPEYRGWRSPVEPSSTGEPSLVLSQEKPGLRELGRAPAGQGSPLSICRNFHEVICRKQKGLVRDPTGWVRPDLEGELEALRIVQELRRENPEWDGEQLDEALAVRIYSPPRRKRLQGAFQWAQGSIIRMIQREKRAFSANQRRYLVDRLKKVQLDLPPPASAYADEPDLLTKNDVVYERLVDGSTRLRVGGAFLFTSASWFNLVFTFAHELAHTIDPCEMRAANQKFAAYDHLRSCFVSQGLVPPTEPHLFCSPNDQVSESFADWFAVRVIAEALRHYATEFSGSQVTAAAVNSVRDLCDQDQSLDELDHQLHPAPEIRIEKIFGSSPEIRSALGCQAEPGSYCSLEWRPFER